MISQFLYISHSLSKQLATLRTADKKAELAAARCEALLADIKRFGCQAPVVAGKRTRNGEHRIKNCVKYDLGGGYRLITIRSQGNLFALFAGTHDEADQWLERHRCDNFLPDVVSCRSERIASQAPPAPTVNHGQALDEEDHDTYEEALRGRLDETCLKAVFQGLFTSPAMAKESGREGVHGG